MPLDLRQLPIEPATGVIHEWEVPGSVVEFPARVVVRVIREPRDHCYNCQHRRVLYRIAVSTSIGAAQADKTEARCAPCWGIRP